MLRANKIAAPVVFGHTMATKRVKSSNWVYCIYTFLLLVLIFTIHQVTSQPCGSSFIFDSFSTELQNKRNRKYPVFKILGAGPDFDRGVKVKRVSNLGAFEYWFISNYNISLQNVQSSNCLYRLAEKHSQIVSALISTCFHHEVGDENLKNLDDSHKKNHFDSLAFETTGFLKLTNGSIWEINRAGCVGQRSDGAGTPLDALSGVSSTKEAARGNIINLPPMLYRRAAENQPESLIQYFWIDLAIENDLVRHYGAQLKNVISQFGAMVESFFPGGFMDLTGRRIGVRLRRTILFTQSSFSGGLESVNLLEKWRRKWISIAERSSGGYYMTLASIQKSEKASKSFGYHNYNHVSICGNSTAAILTSYLDKDGVASLYHEILHNLGASDDTSSNKVPSFCPLGHLMDLDSKKPSLSNCTQASLNAILPKSNLTCFYTNAPAAVETIYGDAETQAGVSSSSLQTDVQKSTAVQSASDNEDQVKIYNNLRESLKKNIMFDIKKKLAQNKKLSFLNNGLSLSKSGRTAFVRQPVPLQKSTPSPTLAAQNSISSNVEKKSNGLGRTDSAARFTAPFTAPFPVSSAASSAALSAAANVKKIAALLPALEIKNSNSQFLQNSNLRPSLLEPNSAPYSRIVPSVSGSLQFTPKSANFREAIAQNEAENSYQLKNPTEIATDLGRNLGVGSAQMKNAVAVGNTVFNPNQAAAPVPIKIGDANKESKLRASANEASFSSSNSNQNSVPAGNFIANQNSVQAADAASSRGTADSSRSQNSGEITSSSATGSSSGKVKDFIESSDKGLNADKSSSAAALTENAFENGQKIVDTTPQVESRSPEESNVSFNSLSSEKGDPPKPLPDTEKDDSLNILRQSFLEPVDEIRETSLQNEIIPKDNPLATSSTMESAVQQQTGQEFLQNQIISPQLAVETDKQSEAIVEADQQKFSKDSDKIISSANLSEGQENITKDVELSEDEKRNESLDMTSEESKKIVKSELPETIPQDQNFDEKASLNAETLIVSQKHEESKNSDINGDNNGANSNSIDVTKPSQDSQPPLENSSFNQNFDSSVVTTPSQELLPPHLENSNNAQNQDAQEEIMPTENDGENLGTSGPEISSETTNHVSESNESSGSDAESGFE